MIANPPPTDISRYYVWAAVAASFEIEKWELSFWHILLVISILWLLSRNLGMMKPFQYTMMGLAVVFLPGAL